MGQGCIGGGSPPQDQQVRIVVLDGAMSSTEQDRLIQDEVNAAKRDARGGLIQLIEYDPDSSIAGSSLSSASSGSGGPTSSIAGSAGSKSFDVPSSSLEGSASSSSSSDGPKPKAKSAVRSQTPSKGVSRKRPPAAGGKSKSSKSRSNKSSAAPTDQKPLASSGVESSLVSSADDSSTTGKSGAAGKSTAGRTSKGGQKVAGNKASSNKKTGKDKCPQAQPQNNYPKPPAKKAHSGLYKTDSSEFASPYRFPAEPTPVPPSLASSSSSSDDDDDGGTAIGSSKNTMPHPKIARPKVKLKVRPASARSTSSSQSGRSIGNWRSISEESLTSTTGTSKGGDGSKRKGSSKKPTSARETQQQRAEGCTIRHREDPDTA